MGISLSACLSATAVFLWLTESAQTAAESERLWDPLHDGKHQQSLYQTISLIRPFTFDFNYRPVKFYDTITVTKISWPTSQQTNTNTCQSIWDCASSQRHLQDHEFSQRYTAAQGENNTSHASRAGNKPEQTIGPIMKPQNNRFSPSPSYLMRHGWIFGVGLRTQKNKYYIHIILLTIAIIIYLLV